MAYLGRSLVTGNYLKLDSIKPYFDGINKTFNLTTGGTPFYPGSAYSILVSVAGVVLEPNSQYTIDRNQITFLNPPASSDSFFCISLGTSVSIGIPGDGTITGEKLAGQLNYDSGLLYLDSLTDRIGIGTTNPTSKLHVIGSGNFTGVVTASQFSTGASGVGINIGVGTITGPALMTLDPAAVGDNTGAVRIRGDLYVDGTQTFINSTTIELADFNVGIATTVGTNALLDGAGIGIGSTGIRKTITWNNSASALTSSEDWNLVSGKQYEINGTSVLNATTLGSGVVNSSLTSIGTLGQLTVTGVSTFTNGPVLIGSATSTGTASQRLQVTGGAYVSGTVGFGTSNPLAYLDLFAPGSEQLHITSSSGGYFFAGYDGLTNKARIGSYKASPGWTDLLINEGGGNVIIGSTSATGTASQPLQVTGGAYISGNLGVGGTSPVFFYGGSGNIELSTVLRFRGNAEIAYANNAFNINNFAATSTIFYTANTARMTLDASGNLGLGASTSSGTTYGLYLKNNANVSFAGAISYYDSNSAYSSGADRYIVNAAATRYQHINGAHIWYNAPVGIAGSSIGFSQAMTLNSGGNLLLNTVTDGPFGRNLILNGTNSSGILFRVGDVSKGFVYADSTDTYIGANTGAVAFKPADIERMRLNANGNLGINTTIINTKLNVVGIQTTDVNSSTVGPTLISNSTNNVDTTALQTVLSLQRFGKSGSSYNSQVNFNVGRYSQSGTGGNTQLTLRLTNGNTNDPDTDVMSLWANGNVGIGTINPGGNRLRVNKDLGTNDYISVAQHNSQFQIGRVSDNKSLEFAVLDNGTSVIQSKEVSVGYNNLAIQPSANVLINSLTATGTASQALQVNSGAYFNGNVAIGITNPTSTLHVVGSFYNSISVNSTTTIFEHTGANAPVPFSISKSGFTGTSKDYGILYLDLANNTVGNGSNLHFTLRNSANGLTEYAGLGGIINSNTAGSYSGSLVFYTSNSGVNRNERARIDNLGNFGVNTISPLQRLDVRGNFLLAADGTTANHITQRPYTINNGTLSWEGSAGQLFSITNNLTSGSIFSVNDVSGIPSIDVNADGTVLLAPYNGNVNMGGVLGFLKAGGTASTNIRIGDSSTGSAITTGIYNFFAGISAGRCNTGGSFNNFIGYGAGNCNTGTYVEGDVCNYCGDFNNFFGYFAGYCNNGGSYNNFLGCQSGYKNTTGADNNFFGRQAGLCNTAGSVNNFFGSFAGRSNTVSYNNNFFGASAGYSNSTGSSNNFFGSYAGYSNVSGCNNVFIGFEAGYSSTGSNNIAIGHQSGNGASPGLINLTSQANYIIMGNNSHSCAVIQSAWTVYSDIRDKHVYGNVPHGMNFLRNINPIKYSFKDRETNQIKDERIRYGFSAQEIMENEGENPVIASFMNGENNLGMTQDYLLPVLVNAIKELDIENSQLKLRLELLEERVGITSS